MGSRNPDDWIRWFQELEVEGENCDLSIENEEVLGENDSNEEENDAVEERIDNSETEQEIDQEESEDECDAKTPSFSGLFYLSKNNMKWYKHKPPTSRTRSHNLISQIPGPKGNEAKNTKTSEPFSLFIDASIIQEITAYTNIYMEHIQKKRC